VLSGAEVAIVGCRPPGHLCGSEHCRTDALALTVSKQGRRVANFCDSHTAAVWLSTAKKLFLL